MLRDLARKYALQNAVLYGGQAQVKAVTGKVLAHDPELRTKPKDVARIVAEVVAEVNALSPGDQFRELEVSAPELLEAHREERPSELPDLPRVKDTVVMRLAPYPSGPLHIGNARMVILNDEYVKRYGGRLLLVHDDTIGSEEKVPIPEAYGLVEEGLEWLGVECHDVLFKSDRLPTFYEWGRRLLEVEGAYICLCSAQELREKREAGRQCEHRDFGREENLERWDEMLAGAYAEGEAVVRLKTDMQHPNPAFRDRVLFRISDREHPRVGVRYRVWPLLEFSWAVDDHILGITHVLRGKDLVMEDEMERAIWDYLGIQGPSFVHYGVLRLKDAELSKSAQRRLIEAGRLTGADDPRTWSLQSLKARGIRPEALRSFILSFGLSLTDIEVPAETLYTENRRLIDSEANRYFFVPEPNAVRIEGLPELREAHPLIHPDFPERGNRTIPGSEEVLLSQRDVTTHKGEEVRLKDWCNIQLDDVVRFTSWEVKNVPKIQWLSVGVPTRVLMPDGSWMEGVGEAVISELPEGALVQFERFGFARLRKTGQHPEFSFAHR